jgi:Ser/Thr protein kinase RdoA (MazF antagonist)
MEFIDYLKKNDASVPIVYHSINNQIVEKVSCENNQYFSITCYSKAKGSFVKKEDMNSELFYLLGKDIGRLHQLTKNYQPVNKRIEWYEEDYISDCIRYLTEEDELILKKSYEIFKKIKSLPKSENNYGLIHTDLHFHNMFYKEGKFTFFDFDDSSYKYFISDIAIVLYYYFVFNDRSSNRIEKTKEILVPFMKGYQTENKLDHKEFILLNDFLKLRETILYLVVKADSFKETNNPQTHHFLSYLKKNIEEDIPFYSDLSFIDEIFNV